MNNVSTQKVTVAARVPQELADAVRGLAAAGDRTPSREIAAAIREHVRRSDVGQDFRASPGPSPAAPAEAQPMSAADSEPRQAAREGGNP